MKRIFPLLLTALLLATAAGFSLAEGAADATTSATQAPATVDGAQAPASTDGTRFMGRVTAVEDGSITLSTMGGMQQPQGGSGQPDNGRQGVADGQTNDGQKGGMPSQDNKGQPDNNGGQANGSAPQNGDNGQAAPTGDQTVTIAITGDTVITSQETQAALTLADLTTDVMVTVTVTGDETNGYTALTIVVQPSLQAPAATDGGSAS